MRGVHSKKRGRESARAMRERVGQREPWGRERESEAGGRRGREKKSEDKEKN